VEVTLKASIERQVRTLDEPALRWGRESVVSTSTERVGSAVQKFVIEVVERE
jgi:hypothetical protein